MATVDDLRTRLAALIPRQRVDAATVQSDDDLVEALRLGRPLPDPDDPLAHLLAGWRARSRD
jgi:hypothetical protein